MGILFTFSDIRIFNPSAITESAQSFIYLQLMNHRITIFLLLFTSCTASKKNIVKPDSNHFPTTVEKSTSLPARENFYIFILAGQSNMAGRGLVQPQDR